METQQPRSLSNVPCLGYQNPWYEYVYFPVEYATFRFQMQSPVDRLIRWNCIQIIWPNAMLREKGCLGSRSSERWTVSIAHYLKWTSNEHLFKQDFLWLWCPTSVFMHLIQSVPSISTHRDTSPWNLMPSDNLALNPPACICSTAEGDIFPCSSFQFFKGRKLNNSCGCLFAAQLEQRAGHRLLNPVLISVGLLPEPGVAAFHLLRCSRPRSSWVLFTVSAEPTPLPRRPSTQQSSNYFQPTKQTKIRSF